MKGRDISAILACDDNFGISKDGKIPWYISEDLQFYKSQTLGAFVAVGRRTFESLPNEAKKDRDYIVLTHSADSVKEIEGFPTAKDIYEVFRICDLRNKKKERSLYVAGGAQTYHAFEGYINTYFITHVRGIYDCDVRFNLEKILKYSNCRYTLRVEKDFDIQMVIM